MTRSVAAALAAMGIALTGCAMGPDQPTSPSATATLKGAVLEPTASPTPTGSDHGSVVIAGAGAQCPVDAATVSAALGVEITRVHHQTFRFDDESYCTYLGTPTVVLDLYVLPDDGRFEMTACAGGANATALLVATSSSPTPELETVDCGGRVDMRFTSGSYNVVMDASVTPTEANLAALAEIAASIDHVVSG
jgi:hypothetical protein